MLNFNKIKMCEIDKDYENVYGTDLLLTIKYKKYVHVQVKYIILTFIQSNCSRLIKNYKILC